MNHILGAGGRKRLRHLAETGALLAFDFDGTLAPIVADRDRAAMRPRTRELLARLSALYPCAVISGRGRDDVAARLNGLGIKHVVGNHGLEPSAGMREYAEVAARGYRHLSQELEPRDIEDKIYSLAVHFRPCGDDGDAPPEVLSAVAGLPVPMRVIRGKHVVNLVPEGAPNKGDALRQLKESEGLQMALYVGDDVTDEDVFHLGRTARVLGVRVGETRFSAAPYFVRDQWELDELLETLGSLREAVLS